MFSYGAGTPVDYLRRAWGQSKVDVRAESREIAVFRQKFTVALRGFDFLGLPSLTSSMGKGCAA